MDPDSPADAFPIYFWLPAKGAVETRDFVIDRLFTLGFEEMGPHPDEHGIYRFARTLEDGTVIHAAVPPLGQATTRNVLQFELREDGSQRNSNRAKDVHHGRQSGV